MASIAINHWATKNKISHVQRKWGWSPCSLKMGKWFLLQRSCDVMYNASEIWVAEKEKLFLITDVFCMKSVVAVVTYVEEIVSSHFPVSCCMDELRKNAKWFQIEQQTLTFHGTNHFKVTTNFYYIVQECNWSLVQGVLLTRNRYSVLKPSHQQWTPLFAVFKAGVCVNPFGSLFFL